ncbi:putative GDP-fucose protein O-fucosyltransferase [Helianthus annuus]|uniref:O-fucosyltransferase family protein n=2 Tax=Helianthus annuus TaxID=4232 RepID=A0A251SZ45_HELAN|nr:putative GDP-fucose protein O-fucosyltransferase [Helianthus annuus]KAJ0861453.1 putative GDP-fucose protein O-fucosyltransferase [Helianthus annuus]
MDIREIMGAVLTFSMFLMLGNMIKRDHFDADVLLDVHPMASSYAYQEDFTQMSRHSLFQLPVDKSKKYGQRSKLCWNNSSPTKEGVQPKGFVTFSLTDGPEYHVSQVANAVLVAKYLGGTLVLPEIIGNKGEKRRFDEIYDADKFITSMSGVIQVEAHKHHEASTKKSIDVKVPYNANRNYIMNNVGPIFQTTQNVRVISYFPSSTTKLAEVDKDTNPYSCWAMFEALRLKPELQKVVDSIVGSLRSRDPSGQFVAIDYKTGMLGTSTCQSNANEGMKNCYNPVEIAQFLQRIGYPRDSTIYVTQSKADRSLSLLKDLYPKTFTKEDIMQEAKMGETSELEQEIIDFHICSVSEVFVPAKSGLFYANVVGNRIATSRIDVLVPAQITSNLAQDHVSSFIAKASHPAYACFC